MNTFDILDFMWFAVRFLSLIALILILLSIILNLIVDQFKRHERRKKEIELNNALTQALKEGAFSVDVIKKDKKEKKDN